MVDLTTHDMHVITEALRVAAEQYRIDATVCFDKHTQPQAGRLERTFNKQADECDKLIVKFEEAE